MEPVKRACFLIVDTNILMDMAAEIQDIDWGLKFGKVFILDSVIDELRQLAKRDAYPVIARTAQEALDKLRRYFPEALNEGFPLPNDNHLIIAKVPEKIAYPLDATNVDHQQISFAIALLKKNPDSFCAVVTRDREMGDIAHAAHPDLQVIMPGPIDPLPAIKTQVLRLLEWGEKLQDESQNKKIGKSVKQKAVEPKSAWRDPQAIIEEIVPSIYARIHSANHQAILSIVPLELRIALSAHMVPLLAEEKQRVVFLFVADEQAAQWWTEQMRRRCKMPAGSIITFGSQPITHVGPARLVIYRHDQIERRLAHHAARFGQAGRKITALVDGCDLLDPVDIAILLFKCDQFIGFTHLPSGHAQAVGSHMLDIFFQQQTLASYTFADAEQDHWLHQFDVLRQEAVLSSDEQELYGQINEDFLVLHGQVTQRYPELQRSEDFWRSLPLILAKNVDHQAAELFSLHEKREALAQMAQAKRGLVSRLVADTGKTARCLIFDVEQIWTKVLSTHLRGQGWTTEIITHQASQDEWTLKWQRFAESKLDCLIVQNIPPLTLNQAVINRLILLTPLSPMNKLAAMTDWTLSHANRGSGVCVDLLYTVGTPEQEAMMDFADTCCGLRYAR